MPEISSYCFSYAKAKQLPSVYSLNTSHGELELDEEMKAAIKEALLPILEKRIDESFHFVAV